MRKPVTLICWAVATIVLSVLNGFGAEGLETLASRLGYWGGIIGLGIFFSALLSRLFLLIREKHGLIVSRLCGPVIFGAFLVPFVYGYNLLFFSYRVDMLPSGWVIFAYGGLMYGAAILIMDGACYHFTGRPFQTIVVDPMAPDMARDGDAESGPAAQATPAFFDRVSQDLGRDLIRLSMQDHYVEVHTALGRELILMRLADAIEELSGVPGLQVHRSHWVALDAVADAVKDQGRTSLRMRDGALVPVSRSYRDAVKAAGLLD